jgi:hypothetical protein
MDDSLSNTQPPDVRLAAWSLGLGLLGYLLALPLVAAGALVCGHLHMNVTSTGPGKGRGMAAAGLIAGYVTWLIYISWRL